MAKHKTTVTQDGKTLLVQVSLQKPKLSTSGKTKIVGTTHGRFTTDLTCEGQRIVVNLNAFIYARRKVDADAAE